MSIRWYGRGGGVFHSQCGVYSWYLVGLPRSDKTPTTTPHIPTELPDAVDRSLNLIVLSDECLMARSHAKTQNPVRNRAIRSTGRQAERVCLPELIRNERTRRRAARPSQFDSPMNSDVMSVRANRVFDPSFIQCCEVKKYTRL